MIDKDLGRTACGTVERPGFDRLVAALCAGQVGAVLCLDASRLARNGRDASSELCGLVEARVIDLDGVIDPCRPNDRRSRMYEAARSMARRGELKISTLIGDAWDRHWSRPRSGSTAAGGDQACVSHSVNSAAPGGAVVDGIAEHPFSLPIGRPDVDIVRMAANQVSQRHLDSEESLLSGRLRVREEREAPHDRRWSCAQQLWPPQADGHMEVFIQDHHEGYISWAEYGRSQALLAGNAHGRVGDTKSGREGAARRSHLLCALRSSAQRSLHR
jgi:hypothetical protein